MYLLKYIQHFLNDFTKNHLTYLFFISFFLFSFPLLSFGESCVSCPTGNRVFVDKDVIMQGDGTSWANAFAEVRDALDTAHVCPNITEIWVAEGTYTPSATQNRIVFFIMRNALTIYGGFDGTETSLNQRDWRNNVTTLSGDLLGDDDNSTLPNTNNNENSFHVIFNFNNDVDSSAVLDGFHVIGGNANIDPPNHVGGGIYNKNASPTIRNCSIYNNYAGYGGGGNYNDKSVMSFDNCVFYNNIGEYRGGAMYSDQATMIMKNCAFFNNHAILPDSGIGGAMFNNGSNPSLLNCTFLNNTATHGGGALCNNGWAKPKLYNCIFWDNGDEIMNTSDDPNNSQPEEFSNCTVNIQNTLIKNSNGSGSNWNLFYGIDDGSNIDVDPMFVDILLGDLHLQDFSPAVNAGNNLLLPQGLIEDLDGDDRIYDFTNGGVVDLGVFEYQGENLLCTVGALCDDGDPCTSGEVFQPDCQCSGGTLVDLDNDNICDSDVADNCVGLNIGALCDDGNPNTVNDVVDTNCNCIGTTPIFCSNLGLSTGDPCDDSDDCTIGETVQNDCTCGGGSWFDVDSDGLCDIDLEDNCFGPNLGNPCDDGDDCTYGETVQPDCTCGGGNLIDIDADGICDTELADNCLGPNVGTFCDDGNPNTVNDEVDIDCNCIGISPLFCPDLGLSIGDPCDDTDDCTVGEFVQNDCNCGGGTMLDNDADGICDTAIEDNCFGPNIGDMCDDADDCTVGESIQDNCNCGGGTILDDDEDGICDLDAADNCIGLNIGDPCDDGDSTTVNDVVDSNCECDGLVNTANLNQLIPSMELYPNPAHSNLFIEIKNVSNISGNIKIFNSLGQLLDNQAINILSSSTTSFDLKNYESGLYFVQVQLEEDQIINSKFLIVR